MISATTIVGRRAHQLISISHRRFCGGRRHLTFRFKNWTCPTPGPDPHYSMTAYGQFCPVALGAEIFAERWTPLILRELLMGGKRFSDIHRGVPRISKNLLTQRLHALQRSGIIEQRATANGYQEYQLTAGGRELGTVIDALGTWGYRWAAKDLTDKDLDPDFLMWSL